MLLLCYINGAYNQLICVLDGRDKHIVLPIFGWKFMDVTENDSAAPKQNMMALKYRKWLKDYLSVHLNNLILFFCNIIF